MINLEKFPKYSDICKACSRLTDEVRVRARSMNERQLYITKIRLDSLTDRLKGGQL